MGLLAVQDALDRITADVAPLAAETAALANGGSRVLAADLAARLTQPPFDASSMDGYAVRADDVADVPVTLDIIGEAAAGHGLHSPLGSGQAARIFTGAPLPPGADAVVIQEVAEREGDRVTVRESVVAGEYVRPRGLDFTEGETLLSTGRRLAARDITLAAAMGHAEYSVRRMPEVAILATGDELVAPGAVPGADQIISSIPDGLAALVESAGGRARRLGIARDSLDSLGEHLQSAKSADVLVTIGGASVGAHDLVQTAVKRMGLTLDFWKIAMRPGKPLMFGRLGDLRVLGLPGNPVSALICGRVFLVPLIHALLGQEASMEMGHVGVLAEELEGNGPRQHYMRAMTRGRDRGGLAIVAPAASQDSSIMSLLSQSDCLIVRPPHAPALPAGAKVNLLTLDF